MRDETVTDNEDEEVDTDDNEMDDILDVAVGAAVEAVSSRRYVLPRKPYRKGGAQGIFARDLQSSDSENGTPPWLTEEEFLQKYRMHRDSFHEILEKIKGHPVFVTKNNNSQAPVEHQLMLFLFYIGMAGSGASNPNNRRFGIGRGTSDVYKRRVVKAIRSLKDSAISWPDSAERVDIAKRMLHKYDWVNLCGIVDGTLLPLTYEPQSSDKPDYKGRKGHYSLTMMVVNDDRKRIRHYHAGFPGSVHDNRVFRNTILYRDPQRYFGEHMYLLGDSAYANTSFCVSAYKAVRNSSLTEDQKKFNTLVGKARVTSEHTIGILKGRFQWLKSIPMVINDNKNSVRRILRVIECCVILHNLLVDVGEDTIPQEWMEIQVDDEEVGQVVGEYRMSEAILEQDRTDVRRQRSMQYFKHNGII